MAHTLLIVEDEETLRESLRRIFERQGYRVETAGSAEQALEFAEDRIYDAVVTDILLPGIDGIELMEKLRESQPDLIVIVMTAYASLDTAVRALRAGAYDYIMKPVMHEEIKQVVSNCLRQRRLERENVILRRQVEADYDFTRIVGGSKSLLSVIDEVKKVADSKSNVLLLGETGTGKELMARVIHANSSRKAMPFVPINCSAIPETLLESELFGHAKGAFTGAVATKTGLLEESNGGTVFLDEIGDMPKAFQVKLLRVIEDHEIRQVGSTKSRKVDLRFVTATNRDLKVAVEKGEFREDLYYRINVITLEMPPLRERKEDIPLLAGHFVRKFAQASGKPGLTLSDEASAMLAAYAWPGNIREMQNVLERAVLISDGEFIETAHLPESIHRKSSFAENSLRDGLTIDDYCRAFILNYQHMLSEQDLAEKLGITRKTLWEKRKKWGLKRPS